MLEVNYIERVLGLMCFVLFVDFVNADLLNANNIIRTLQPPFFDYGNNNNNNNNNNNKNNNYNQYLQQTTTEFFLPEIIINRDALPINAGNEHDVNVNAINIKTPNNAYIPPSNEEPSRYLPPDMNTYYIPQSDITNNIPIYPKPNITFDSSKDIPNSYLPPNELPIIIENDINIYPPLQMEPSRTYLPVQPQGKTLKRFNPKTKLEPLRLELKELRCLGNSNGYFKAILLIHSPIDIPPIIENDIGQGARCDFQLLTKSKISIQIPFNNFQYCGISTCVEQHLCMKIRFPQITGMRTLSDSILTLQCKLQDRVVAKTHAIKLAVSRQSESRNLGVFAHGGSQQPFNTQIGLYRLSKNGFTNILEPGGVVQLGEELLLRAHVKSGDGWNQSRLQDVSLQRMNPFGQTIDTATVITSNGCVNPSMLAMCPDPPIFEPPLGHSLRFKAVMFQGMRSGDEMTMSVRVVGCIDQTDCVLDKNLCNQISTRSKRSSHNFDNNNNRSDVSRISFRVEIPNFDEIQHYQHVKPFILISTIALLCLICLITLIILFVRNKVKFKYLFSN